MIKTIYSLKNWLVFFIIFSFQLCAYGFLAPNQVRAGTDFLLTYIEPPNGVDPDIFRSAVKDIFRFLDSFEDNVEYCIFKRNMVKGCNAATDGINYWPEHPSSRSNIHTISVVDGVITITPSLLPERGIKPSDTIIATPHYIDGNVQWDYSGNLFNIKNINKPVIDAPADYCPDPSILPKRIVNNTSFIDPSSQIKYNISNYYGKNSDNKSYSFLSAGYKGRWKPIFDCVYKIGAVTKEPVTIMGFIKTLYNLIRENKQVFILIPENGIVKIPTGEYWRRTRTEEGVCTGKEQNASVRDCPYWLKRS